MTSGRNPWALVISMAVAGALSFATPGAADWRESYKQGVENIEAGNWSVAERFLREAIRENPESRTNILPRRRYFPYYQLGIAMQGQGDCRSAEEAWKVAAQQGKVTRVSELGGDLERRRRACREALEQVDGLAVEIDELLAQANDTLETLGGLSQRPLLAPLWTSSPKGFADRERRVRGQLDGARSGLAAGRQAQDADALAASRSTAEKALADLDRLVADARQELGDRNTATAEASDSLEQNERAARSLLRSVKDLEPYPPRLSQRVRELEQLLVDIDRAQDTAQVRQLQDLSQRLDQATRNLRSASIRPPRALRNAVEALLAGDYDTVLSQLEGSEGWRGNRSKGQACVVRSAALYGRHTMDSAWEAAENETERLAALSTEDPLGDGPGEQDGLGDKDSPGDQDGPGDDIPQEDTPMGDSPTDDIADGATPTESEVELTAPEDLASGDEEPVVERISREAVVEAILACADFDPPPSVPRRFFSPSFLALYDATMAEGATADDIEGTLDAASGE